MNSAAQEVIRFNDGMEHDLEEGWEKITSRQQPGRPAKAFKELIQNALDSYPVDVPISERKGEILIGDKYIAMKDFGEGMSYEQVTMLYTVGGTSKFGVNSLIGNFGLGFKQLFNIRLGTTKVRVKTHTEDLPVELVFTVLDPKSAPDIDTKVLDKSFDYGTMVEVFFDNNNSAMECLEEAEKSLKYYPCQFTTNGTKSISEWDRAKKSGAFFFSKNGIDGFIEPAFHNDESRISVLCKYEYISRYYVSYLMVGSTKPYDTLQDYGYKGTPYIPGLNIVVNSNDLNVVISRDSFFCDSAFNELIAAVNEALLEYLADYLTANSDKQLVLANIYSLRVKLANYMDNPGDYKPEEASTRALKKLTELKVFKVAERRELFSIWDIVTSRTPDLPLFYSPRQRNVRWLGGNFKHDYVITPHAFTLEGGLRGFYDLVFSSLFKDTINLDHIYRNVNILKDLVERGIVDPEALSPEVKFVGNATLNEHQKTLLEEINALLANEDVRKVISENFEKDIKHIHTAFFDVADGGMYISTGLFDSKGNPLVDEYITNIVNVDPKKEVKRRGIKKKNILLGLNLRHPLISYLAICKDPNRAAYSLTYVVNQLSMCQHSLVPYLGFYQLDKAKLAKGMRAALLAVMTDDNNEDKK